MTDETRNPPSYKVGHGKPPLHSRFRPGQSGNQKGRPKRVETMREMIERIGRETVIATENGTPRRMSRVEAVALKTMALAVQGDTKAAADFIRIATLMGEFASGGPKHTEAGHLVVQKRAETPEEKELFLLELAEFRRKYVAGELYPKFEDLKQSHQTGSASSPATDSSIVAPQRAAPKPVR